MTPRIPFFRKAAFGVLFLIVSLVLFTCGGCGTHDASDPEYGAMFKKTTRDRVQGTEFWGSQTDKDCTPGTAIEVCTPKSVSQNQN